MNLSLYLNSPKRGLSPCLPACHRRSESPLQKTHSFASNASISIVASSCC